LGLALVTGPTEEPVSLIEAKQHCRIDSTDDDGLLAGYILAARTYAEGETRRAFVTQTWDYTVDSWYRGNYERLELPLGKLQSVTTITYVDDSGATQTLAADQYTVISDGTSGVIVPAYGITWPSTRCQPNAITVRMVVGWLAPEFPPDLTQAMLLLISSWYENREAVVIGQAPSALPMATEAILSGYKITRML
jgi:uncharacterized phiE125 gp8 family phage protein